MIRSSGKEGELDDAELALLTRAISFTEKVAADIMVPRVAVDFRYRHESGAGGWRRWERALWLTAGMAVALLVTFAAREWRGREASARASHGSFALPGHW